MPALCTGCEIDNDVLATCQTLAGVGGIQPVLYIINLCDIDGYDIDSPGNWVKNIDKVALKQFFKFSIVNYQGVPSSTFNDTDTKNYTHAVQFKIPGLKQSTTNLIEKLSLGEVVVLVQSRNQNDAVLPIFKENRLFILGMFNGMRAIVNTVTMGPGKDTLSGYDLTLDGCEVEHMKEIIPDPIVYPSNNPISEFLVAMCAP